ncbi:MAG: LapA family protein [Clostridia bacterium]|nr:LapA family protein [Clostridiales bacterium]
MQLTYIFALIFALVVAVFALLNAQPVTVDFAFNEFQISLALVILISAFAGAIILGFMGLFRQVKEGFKFRDMNMRIKKLEEQLKETGDKLAIAGAELEVAKAGLVEKDERIRILAESLAKEEEEKEAVQDQEE